MLGPDNLDARSARSVGINPFPNEEPRPLQGPLVDELLGILPRRLGLTPEDLLENPDVRILEDNEDPDAVTLGTSSLQALRAMNAVEEKYGFQVPEDQLASFRTFRSIVDRVEAEIAARQPGAQSP